jgi:GxxExxY protein
MDSHTVEDDTQTIITQCCNDALKSLGTGVSERGYQKAVRHALVRYQHILHVAEEAPVPITYHKEDVETMRIDLVVTPQSGPIHLLEFKGLTKCFCDTDKHRQVREWFQLQAYLRHYKPGTPKVGALVNFLQNELGDHVCFVWDMRP